ncbi:MAG TPA: LEA type 2 family protein [Tepidisphaeraceae bacterium]|nr:LEA type 2 family protein [Tepidisphaeraceae bacterium]
MTRLALALWLVAVCGGCAYQKPTATFHDLSVAQVSTQGIALNLDLNVHNPNGFAVAVAEAEYTFRLSKYEVIRGAKLRPEGPVAANGSRVVRVPVTVTFEMLWGVADTLRAGGGVVDYTLDVGVDVETGIPIVGRQRVPLSYTGTLDVGKLIKDHWRTILTSPTARKLASEVLGGLGLWGS